MTKLVLGSSQAGKSSFAHLQSILQSSDEMLIDPHKSLAASILKYASPRHHQIWLLIFLHLKRFVVWYWG